MSGMSQCHFQSGELSEAENASSIIERVDSVNSQQVLDLPYTFTTSPAGGLLDSDCRCIIIWLTAARLRDSDCHCISCSFLQHSFVSLFPITVQFSRRCMMHMRCCRCFVIVLRGREMRSEDTCILENCIVILCNLWHGVE